MTDKLSIKYELIDTCILRTAYHAFVLPLVQDGGMTQFAEHYNGRWNGMYFTFNDEESMTAFLLTWA
jgi:hypothetical protein